MRQWRVRVRQAQTPDYVHDRFPHEEARDQSQTRLGQQSQLGRVSVRAGLASVLARPTSSCSWRCSSSRSCVQRASTGRSRRPTRPSLNSALPRTRRGPSSRVQALLLVCRRSLQAPWRRRRVQSGPRPRAHYVQSREHQSQTRRPSREQAPGRREQASNRTRLLLRQSPRALGHLQGHSQALSRRLCRRRR